jgi:FAD/FMN-containing dehydrogenase
MRWEETTELDVAAGHIRDELLSLRAVASQGGPGRRDRSTRPRTASGPSYLNLIQLFADGS